MCLENADIKPSAVPKTGQPACLATWLLGVLVVPAALGQPMVELNVRTARPYVNEAVLVELRVDNADRFEQPEFPELPNCSIQYVGQSSGSQITQFGGGRPEVKRHVTFSYTLTPHKAGELTIPPIVVVVDGKTLKTKPRQLTVRALPASPSPRAGERANTDDQTSAVLLAEITCHQSRLHVGQRADFTLTIWVKPAEDRGQPLRQSEMLRFITGSFGPFDTEDVRTSQVRLPRNEGSTELYYAVELPARFVVDQPGPLTFADVSVGMNYPTQFSRDLFGDLRVTRQQKVPRMRPLITAPDVQPLPAEGRPANFSGAVGRFELSVIAVPTNVRVGDPIELTIELRGDGPVETLPAPPLTAIPRLVEDFRVPSETLAGTYMAGYKRFTQVIRAKRADVKEIPPIEFAYFDPQVEEYVVARSEPIPILVAAAEQLDVSDLTSIAAHPPAEQGSSLQARDGLRGNKTSELELLATTRPVTMTQVVSATAAGPALFICTWGCAALARSRRDQAAQRRRGALRNAERRITAAAAGKLPPGQFHREIQAALAGYLGDRLNEPPARFLGRDAVASLQEHSVDRELVELCAELLDFCERAAYAGDADSDASLAYSARECVRRLERERL